MKLTIKYRLELTEEQEEVLKKLCCYATKLYNTDNWQRREEWSKTGKIPNWYEQKKRLKDNHWYKLLPSQTAQAVVKNLQDNYVSWFKLRKDDPRARPPGFRRKNKLSPLTFYQQFTIEGDTITLVMSRKFREEEGVDKLFIKVSKWREIEGEAKMCNIIYDDTKWMAHIVYEVPEVPLRNNPGIIAIDIGIINLVASVDTQGNSTIYSGKQALSIQHYFNKEIAKVQSKTMNQYKRRGSETITKMHRRKRRQINQIIHTITKEVIEEAERNNVGVIVCGDVKNIRRNKNWGKRGNQKLHTWAFAKLLSQIEYKAKLSGIRFEKVEERGTSKTCSVCGAMRRANRKYRGLYVCKSCGAVINADINGARNILKRYLQEKNISRSIGVVDTPLTWGVQNVVPA